MSSVFRKDDNFVDKPNRNTFDLSTQNNLTLKFGNLVPVFCQEVLPGDSFKIDPTFALRYMPQVFPVQTRQRGSVKFYYVRNRNMWKDWMDFVGKTKTGLTPPYLQFKGNEHRYFLRPSSLADYLGVPIKINVPYGSLRQFELGDITAAQGYTEGRNDYDYAYVPNGVTLSNTIDEPNSILTHKNVSVEGYIPTSNDYADKAFELSSIYGGVKNISDSSIPVAKVANLTGFATSIKKKANFCLFRKPWIVDFKVTANISVKAPYYDKLYLIVHSNEYGDIAIPFTGLGQNQIFNIELVSNKVTFYMVDPDNGVDIVSYSTTIDSVIGLVGFQSYPTATKITLESSRLVVNAAENPNLCWCDVALSELPFASTENPDGIRISALPFRAYLSIYNALIRNAENNPLVIDGVPEYNKYLYSTDGGAVTDLWKILEMKQCNWSDDRFTTALPSPQQGNAPLVGLTGVNGATLTTSTEDGTTSTLHLQVDSDTGNVVFVDGVSSSSPEYLNDAMMSAVEYGITINDLRNVNSFQRWLENNIRRGYKYKDQLMSHYGVSAKYDVLDMPEFLGGVSRDVNVEQITQTVENEYGKLGEYGGNSYLMGSGHSIEHYCDEHGFIIGIMDVKPMPLYSDALPKYLVKQDAFDYYFPEFGKIGMQPITNKELDFSLSVMSDDVDGTFGYQRAWYDYLENLDQVHGSFRFDLRNYILGRDFNTMPKLNNSFLTVTSDDLNNTFYSDDDEDKIIGQVYLKVSAKRPIPMVGIPALE